MPDTMAAGSKEGTHLSDDLQARLNALKFADDTDSLSPQRGDEQSLDSLTARLAALHAPLISSEALLESPLDTASTLDPSRFPAVPGAEGATSPAHPPLPPQ